MIIYSQDYGINWGAILYILAQIVAVVYPFWRSRYQSARGSLIAMLYTNITIAVCAGAFHALGKNGVGVVVAGLLFAMITFVFYEQSERRDELDDF
jgi:hypothetical protein